MSASTTLNVPATSASTRQNVGTISVIAFYYDGPNPFSSTQVVSAYQAANQQTTTWTAYNRSEWNVYGNLLTGNTEAYDGLETLSGETENHYSTVPAGITEAWLALSPAPANPQSYSIVLSNSTYGDSMICTYDGSAWIGTGLIRLVDGTVLDIAVGQL